VIRVRVKITHRNKEIITTALLNSGFGTSVPKALIPLKLAQMLELYPPRKRIGTKRVYCWRGSSCTIY